MTDFKAKLIQYFWNILIAVDQFANTLLGGDPDETMSSRMGKNIRAGKCKLCKLTCYFLGLIQKDHCDKSIEPDRGSRQVFND
jgi:hypothetical protein